MGVLWTSTPTVSAHTGARSVALVGLGDALDHAVYAALEPWNIRAVVVACAVPGAAAPRVHELARACARANAVSAVVWISEHDRGYALWIYDLSTDQVVARALPRAPPFDEATTAAVALSVKTLLRHSTSAPKSERFGAVPDAGSSAAQVSGVAAKRAPARPAGPSPFDIESTGALRGRRTRPNHYEPRFGVGVSWWPATGGLASAIRVSIGPGVAVADSRFQGRLLDTELVLTARMRRRFEERLQLSAGAGLGAQVTVLDGTVLSEARHVHVLRAEPSLHAELQADWQLTSWLRLGVRGAGLSMLRTQHYLVAGVRVLSISRSAFEVGFVLGISVPN